MQRMRTDLGATTVCGREGMGQSWSAICLIICKLDEFCDISRANRQPSPSHFNLREDTCMLVEVSCALELVTSYGKSP